MTITEAPTSRRERNKVRNRTRIVDAMRGLIETMPAAEVTVDQISELADLSSRTFFRYFDTKTACMLAVCGLEPWLTAEAFSFDAEGVVTIEPEQVGIDRVMLRHLVAERELSRGVIAEALDGGSLDMFPAAARVAAALLKG